ncbi:MAG TPA: hypothetical protein VIU64_15135 [Polyangia bacterium]
MTRTSLLIGVLTVLGFPMPSVGAPALPAAVPPPVALVEAPPSPAVAPTPSPWPQIGLGSLQLLAGYGAGIGGVVALDAAGVTPKKAGIHSDYANVAYVGLLTPALASAAVCGVGYLGSRFQGRCSTTLVGAYAGAVLGVLLGFLVAPSPGPDDTAAFTNSMFAIAGAALLAPMGAVAGWHVGKRETAPLAPAQPLTARNPSVPMLGLSW